MKNKILKVLLFICLFLVNCNVYAESKDVQAIYKQSYNVTLVTKTINNNTVTLEMDDLDIELSSPYNNIKVVLIKTEDEANNYAKTFTKSTSNYYLALYSGEKKIESSNFNIQIKTKNKVLNVYDNNGKLLEKSDEKINLTGNDYFLTISNLIDVEEGKYKVTKIDSLIDDLKDIGLNNNSKVEIYNSKEQKILNSEKLGTNYKIVVDNDGVKSIYTIVVMGDTTGDALITLNDITRLYHYYKGIEKMEESYILAGDVAFNEIINLNDVTKIYHYYKKIIPSL